MRTVNCDYGERMDTVNDIYYSAANATSTHSMVQTMQCWSGTHLFYVFLAVVALLAYYPMASFIYPQLQFCDKHADVKYTTSFVVLLNQAKLNPNRNPNPNPNWLNQAKLIVVGLVIFYNKHDIAFVNFSATIMCAAPPTPLPPPCSRSRRFLSVP